MTQQPPILRTLVGRLRDLYGPVSVPVTDPFEMILLENAAYLVDDAKRSQTFERLRREIGVTPEAILARSPSEIAAVIAEGGMQPMNRAAKVITSARLGAKLGLGQLRAMVTGDPARAKKALQEFPGVGEPLADRILLFAGSQRTLAPDSNALRVLLRLGFGREAKSYPAMYRSALDATDGVFTTAAEAQDAHSLLRRHGQELCKRTAPRCELCPLRSDCAWYLTLRR